jgi:hypothetical protein
MQEFKSLINKNKRCKKYSPQHAYKRIQTLDMTSEKTLGSSVLYLLSESSVRIILGCGQMGKGGASGNVKRKIKGETRLMFALFAP